MIGDADVRTRMASVLMLMLRCWRVAACNQQTGTKNPLLASCRLSVGRAGCA